MARKVTPLTDSKIKMSKVLKDKNYTLSDGNGLHLLIKKDGKKLWEFLYTSPTLFKRRKTSFGSYPQNTLKTARIRRNEYINIISQGIDPLSQKEEAKRNIYLQINSNFKLIADEWLELEAIKTIKSTHKRKKATFINDIYPYFEKKSIINITHQDIIEVVQKKMKKGLEGANKVFRNLNTVWKYAITKGLCTTNPFNDIIKELIIPRKETIHFPKITDTNTLKHLVNKIYKYKGHHSTKAILKLVLHLPLRANNLTNLKWKYINFDNKMLIIPRELMKTKNMNLPDFKMPLTDIVIRILKEQLELTKHQEYVFLGLGGRTINSVTPNAGLKRMGFIKDRKQTLHSFRGTFRSLADTYQTEHNSTFEVKERALDHHERNKVARAYSHQAEYFEQLKPLMTWWSGYINSLVQNS